jgi:hypothetical protein
MFTDGHICTENKGVTDDNTRHVPTANLRLILRNTQQVTRDAQAAIAAVERLIGGLGARFEAIEARQAAIEQRQSAMEVSIARRNQMLTDLLNGGDVDTVSLHIKEVASIMTMIEPTPAFPNRRDHDEPMWVEP